MPDRHESAGDGYRYGFNGMEADDEIKEKKGTSYDFGARMYDPRVGRWLSTDPLEMESPSLAPYVFAANSPVILIDPDGEKEKPYKKGKDKPVQEVVSKRTFIVKDENDKSVACAQNNEAYNCHSFAWHNSKGDSYSETSHVGWENDPNTPKWDNDPEDDIFNQRAVQLGKDTRNKVGDKVIYYQDDNANGAWDKGEKIHHSALVKEVDKQGNTITVEGKMGQMGTSVNHPDAPDYYETDNGESDGIPLARAYMRTGARMQRLGSVNFDSNMNQKRTDATGTNYVIIQDVNTGKDYGAQRQSDGSYKFYTPKK